MYVDLQQQNDDGSYNADDLSAEPQVICIWHITLL